MGRKVKFKVGDRVLVRNLPYCLNENERAGIIVGKAEAGSRGEWNVRLDNYTLSFLETELVPVAEATGTDAAPKFKVGDRVRFTDRCLVSWWFGPHTENKEGEIVSPDTSFGYKWRVRIGGSYGYVDDDHIEPVTPAAPADTTGYTVPLCAYEDAGGLFEIKNGKVTFRTQTIRLSSKQPAIVCLLENGKPRPATRPYVHPDRASAEREARRLAANNKGKEFAVYNCVYTAKVEPAYKHEWQRLAADGNLFGAANNLTKLSGIDYDTAYKTATAIWMAA